MVNISSQPVSSGQWVNVGTLGTTAYPNAAALTSVVLGGTFVGSVEFYDSSTTAGTSAGNKIYNVGLPLLNAYSAVPVNLRLRNGLTVVATGTPSLLFTFE